MFHFNSKSQSIFHNNESTNKEVNVVLNKELSDLARISCFWLE
jgi:hypothetical protein